MLGLVVSFYQFPGLVNVYLAFDMLTGRLLQIFGRLQAIDGLQADSGPPKSRLLSLIRFTLLDVLIEIYVAVFHYLKCQFLLSVTSGEIQVIGFRISYAKIAQSVDKVPFLLVEFIRVVDDTKAGSIFSPSHPSDDDMSEREV